MHSTLFTDLHSHPTEIIENVYTMAMDGHVSSSSTIEAALKNELDSQTWSTWSDDLYSNVRHTKSWYCEEIKKLKAEISTLTENVKEDRQTFQITSNGIVEKLLSKLPDDKRGVLEDLDVKGKQNGDEIIDVSLLEQFTGFRIDDISVTVEQQKNEIILRKHNLRGSCYDVEFQTTFLVEENGSQENKHEITGGQEECVAKKLPKIIDLTVAINNQMVDFDMRNFLACVREEKKLHQFFLTLQAYLKWKRQRLKTFCHFSEKYPKLVSFSSLQDESILAICKPEYPAIRLNIIWKIVVTKEGQTIPTFDLLSCIPEGLTEVDNTSLLKRLRRKFHSLLKTIGIEKSVEAIINVIAK